MNDIRRSCFFVFTPAIVSDVFTMHCVIFIFKTSTDLLMFIVCACFELFFYNRIFLLLLNPLRMLVQLNIDGTTVL